MLILGYQFENLGDVEVERDEGGVPTTHVPEAPADEPSGTWLHAYGHGPFCTLAPPEMPWTGGVYAIVVDGDVKYVGQSADVTRQFGQSGFGSICRANCRDGRGQQTNCRINNLVLGATQDGLAVVLWLHRACDRNRVKREIVSALAPEWNLTGK